MVIIIAKLMNIFLIIKVRIHNHCATKFAECAMQFICVKYISLYNFSFDHNFTLQTLPNNILVITDRNYIMDH